MKFMTLLRKIMSLKLVAGSQEMNLDHGKNLCVLWVVY